jgi:hypothetical protein
MAIDREKVKAIIEQNNPTASPKEVMDMVDTFAPQEQISQVTAPSMDLNIPSANDTSSSFDVGVSDNTVTQNGSPESLPHANTLEQPTPMPEVPTTPEPMQMPPQEMPVMSPKAQVPPAAQSSTGKATTAAPDPLKALVDTSSNDDEARRRMLEGQKGGIGTALQSFGAGVADAMGNAAVSLGGQGASGTQQRVIAQQEKDKAAGRTDFEASLKNDPNSDVSKSYREMVLQITPELAKNPNFLKMSAQMIGDKLPLIDTMMKASAARDAKEMSLAAMKENRANMRSQKDLALSEKEDQFNQRRWERFGAAVNPMNAGSRRALGVAAVNNMRADRLLATAGNKEITSQDYSNIIADLQGIYKGGVPDQQMMKHGDYPSLQRKAGEILGLLSGNPQAIHTPKLMQHLESLTRELKDVDNKVITDNMGFNSVIFDELKKSDPQKFERAMAALSEMSVGVADEPKGAAAQKTASPSMTNKPSSDPMGLF